MVEPSPDIDIAVDSDAYCLLIKADCDRFVLDFTLGLWKIPPPLICSFSSLTDSCSKRDSIALIAMFENWLYRPKE